MTESIKDKYLNNFGVKCPYCDSYNIITTCALEINDGIGTQGIKCNDCKKEWDDVYTLTNIYEYRNGFPE